MDTSTLQSWMSKVVATLRQQLSDTWLHVANTWLTDGEHDAYRSHLDLNQRWIDKLDGELRQQVADGALGIARWQDIAKTQSADMANLFSDAGQGALLDRFYQEVVAQSAGDVSTGVAHVAQELESQLPFWGIGIVVGLVALMVISIAVRR